MAVTGVTESRLDVAHPLDPLSAAEISRVVEILAGEHDLSGCAVRRDRVARSRRRGRSRGSASRVSVRRGRPSWCCTTASRRRLARRSSRSTRGAVRSWREVPGVQAAITLDEYIECEQAVRADPRFREALGAPWDHEPEAGAGGGLVDRRPCPVGRGGAAVGLDALLVPRQPGRQRVCPPDRRAVHRRRPEHDGGAAGRGHK